MFALLLLGLVWGGPVHAKPKPSRPSVILIMLDTVSAKHMSCYGNKYRTTPFIDSIARTGVQFLDEESPGAYTLPSQYSIFTGVAPQTHHLESKPYFSGRTKFVLSHEIPTLTEYLNTAGYTTIWSGVLNHALLNLSGGLDRGFKYFFESAMEDVNPADRKKKLGMAMQAAKDRPAFIFFHTYVAHDPYKPVPPYDQAFGPKFPRLKIQTFSEVGWGPAAPWRSQFNFDSALDKERMRTLYDGGLHTVDTLVKELVAELKRNKLYDNSIIVITSDHGELFGEHGLLFHSEPFRDTLHVPLIFKIPGQKPRKIAAPVNGIDILPTLLDLLQIQPAKLVEGESLLPLIRGKARKLKDRFTYSAGWQSEAVSDGKWKLLIRPHGAMKLFQVQKDPGEIRNLADKHPAEVSRLKTQLEAFKASRLGTLTPDPDPVEKSYAPSTLPLAAK